MDDHIFDGEYLLVAEDGENLRSRKTPVAFLARGKFWVNNHAHIVRANQRADTRYLMYAMSATEIAGYLSGSTMPKLTQGNMNRIPIWAPPLVQQQGVADVLGTFDDKIELNRRMSETLEAMARALFKSWFVDFDRVQAIDDGAGAESPAPVHALSRPGPADMTRGEAPQGWEAGTLADIAVQWTDKADPRTNPDELFHHYSLPAFDDGQRPRWQPGSDIKSVKYSVPEGAVLLSRLNPHIPRVWLTDPVTHVSPVASTEFLVLSPRSPFTREFVYCLASSDGLLQRLQSLATGTSGSHQRARPEDALALPVVLPPKEVIQAFSRLCGPWLDRALVARRETDTLGAVRDALLPRLVSGELQVPVAERMAVEAGV